MRSIALVFCLASVGIAEDLAPVVLPLAGKGLPDGGEENRIVVTLNAAGELRHENKVVTLGELMERMAKAAVLEPGAKASEVPVLLRVDRDAPWVHVQWLMIAMAENRLYRVQFAVKRVADRAYTPQQAKELGAERKDVAPPAKPRLEAKLAMPLPIDKGIRGEANQGAWPELKIAVHIVARKEVAARHAGLPVKKPTAFLYSFGDNRSADLKGVEQWIKNGQRAARGQKLRVVGEIKAGHKVPHKYVIAVLNQFSKAGITDVEFYGTAIPGARTRGAKTLPYPKQNYGKAD